MKGRTHTMEHKVVWKKGNGTYFAVFTTVEVDAHGEIIKMNDWSVLEILLNQGFAMGSRDGYKITAKFRTHANM